VFFVLFLLFRKGLPIGKKTIQSIIQNVNAGGRKRSAGESVGAAHEDSESFDIDFADSEDKRGHVPFSANLGDGFVFRNEEFKGKFYVKIRKEAGTNYGVTLPRNIFENLKRAITRFDQICDNQNK
jgi:hypothetical protein